MNFEDRSLGTHRFTMLTGKEKSSSLLTSIGAQSYLGALSEQGLVSGLFLAAWHCTRAARVITEQAATDADLNLGQVGLQLPGAA